MMTFPKMASLASMTRRTWRSWFQWPLVPLLALAAFGAVIGQSTTAETGAPWVELASEPLYARGVKAKPTLTLALSVEFPTVGAQYRGASDYDPGTEYIGYFNHNRCYRYNPASEQFDPIGQATGHTCGGSGFSGNFMNWAASSAIDILRYSLTGGDRIQDDTSQTVLQRAVLPSNFYNNSSNFPHKSVSNAIAKDALPSDLLRKTDGTTYTGTVHIANCLNRVYFGTDSGGSCGSPGSNGNLGQYGSATSLPDGTSHCAAENGTCNIPTSSNWGQIRVYYGTYQTNQWTYKTFASGVNISCSNSVFGDPANGYVKECRAIGVQNLANQSNNNTVGISAANYFLTRVQVCDKSSGGLSDVRNVNGAERPFCTQYPNGTYKPTGNLQRYSDKVRVAVFGYLEDNTTSRYGGVLRAPMKYVGANTYDADFNLVSGTNPQAEWDLQTGIFKTNPDGNTTIQDLSGNYISGAVNYLNRFGRTGTEGAYKTYDPVNELYYEALRYLQGLAPTAAATANMTAAMKDGFPVYDTWTDPHPAIQSLGNAGDYSCLKNNILTIGDINTHYDSELPGDSSRAANASGNEPDFQFWKKVIAGFENGNSVSYTDNAGTSRTTTGNPNPTNYNILTAIDDGTGSYRNYLGAMTYWANTHDIRGKDWSEANKRRPGMRVTSYFIDVNEYSAWPGDIGTNQFYYAAKYGGFDAGQSVGGNPFTSDGTTYGNGLWARDALSSPKLPKTFFLASDAVTLLNSLDSIFATITSDTASIAGTAISTSRVASTDSAQFFQASFSPSDWSGDVTPYNVNSDGSITQGSWTAAGVFASKASSWADRKIFVGQRSSNAFTARAFTWSNLDASQKDALLAGSTDATLGQWRVDFLRGDRSHAGDAGGLRARGSVLGDIVNAGIAYSGTPTSSISDTSYTSFLSKYKSRTKAAFVGANDGMLHAFNAASGEELFAYIPSFVVKNLSQLTLPSYVHRSYVDATPGVGEAQVNGSWKTVLVGGAGGGGQGVFALDITDPANFDADSALWEFTDADDPDMGNVVGAPGIFKIRTNASGTPVYKWYAVVASGVNNYAHGTRDGITDYADEAATTYSTTGTPAIFILDLSHAPGTKWTEGTDYFKIALPQDYDNLAKGVVNFSALAPAGVLTTLYAGDLQGNLWKLNFSGKSTSDWTLAKLSARMNGNAPIPLFTAKDGSGNRQPITSAPEIVANGSQYVLVFGTGRFMASGDNIAPYQTQSIYAILDGTSSTTPTLDRSYLAKVAAGTGQNLSTATAFAWGIPTSATGASVKAGWYLDLPNSSSTGERIVSDALIANWTIYLNSIIPSSGGCSSGSSNAYTIDLVKGAGNYVANTTGMLGGPLIVRFGNATNTVGASGETLQSVGYKVFSPGTNGITPIQTGTSSTVTGILSWREVFSYDDVRKLYTP